MYLVCYPAYEYLTMKILILFAGLQRKKANSLIVNPRINKTIKKKYIYIYSLMNYHTLPTYSMNDSRKHTAWIKCETRPVGVNHKALPHAAMMHTCDGTF